SKARTAGDSLKPPRTIRCQSRLFATWIPHGYPQWAGRPSVLTSLLGRARPALSRIPSTPVSPAPAKYPDEDPHGKEHARRRAAVIDTAGAATAAAGGARRSTRGGAAAKARAAARRATRAVAAGAARAPGARDSGAAAAGAATPVSRAAGARGARSTRAGAAACTGGTRAPRPRRAAGARGAGATGPGGAARARAPGPRRARPRLKQEPVEVQRTVEHRVQRMHAAHRRERAGLRDPGVVRRGHRALAEQRAGQGIGVELDVAGAGRGDAHLDRTRARIREVDDVVEGVAAGAARHRLSEVDVVAILLGQARLAVVVLALDRSQAVAPRHRALHAEDEQRPSLAVDGEARAVRGAERRRADRLEQGQMLLRLHRLPLRFRRVGRFALAGPDAVGVAVGRVDDELGDEDLLARERGREVADLDGHGVAAGGVQRRVGVVGQDLQ